MHQEAIREEGKRADTVRQEATPALGELVLVAHTEGLRQAATATRPAAGSLAAEVQGEETPVQAAAAAQLVLPGSEPPSALR